VIQGCHDSIVLVGIADNTLEWGEEQKEKEEMVF